ncbi:hypothetical protein IC218_12485 [Clostridioides sp. ES-S-0005-03]|uniref:hypothetical protein n=1 Tax=Clostridioides sp. ES-S-0005-03 TaxID=2770774 RepID=UPI001D13063B|nr:hypothetical protein [Clostridioides sp. ES-S-0005-03]
MTNKEFLEMRSKVREYEGIREMQWQMEDAIKALKYGGELNNINLNFNNDFPKIKNKNIHIARYIEKELIKLFSNTIDECEKYMKEIESN